MNELRFGPLLLASCVSLVAVGTASAGGFDRGGVSIDLLFDPARIATEAGVTYVSPQRTIKNVDRAQNVPFPKLPVTPSIDVKGDYAVPRLGVKMNLFEPVDCLATYTEPYGADSSHGTGNAYSQTSVDFSIDTRDFGLTCSYKMQMGKGTARVIGGISYQEIDAFLSRQTLLFAGNTGLGTFDLSDEALSWRVGAAYEIPEIAFRASLLYSARYKYDGLSGTVDTTGFAGGPLGNVVGVFPVSASAEIPQALELKMQSGIAPDWLAFGSVRWQDWSKLYDVPIEGVINPVFGGASDVSLEPLYRDGWTVTGGIGHKFNDMFSGVASVTWDKGTSTVSGTQSDTWSFGAGGSYLPSEKVEIRLGGSIGVLTSGTSAPGGDAANDVSYSYGNDLLLAGSAAVRIKF